MSKRMNDFQKKVFEHSAYWVEGINIALYDAIVDFMEKHNMNRTELAEHLDISRGRVSQILNDGEINFSIEKLVEIALKINKIPKLEFLDKDEVLLSLEKNREEREKRNNFVGVDE